jgi:hypothetical protein
MKCREVGQSGQKRGNLEFLVTLKTAPRKRLNGGRRLPKWPNLSAMCRLLQCGADPRSKVRLFLRRDLDDTILGHDAVELLPLMRHASRQRHDVSVMSSFCLRSSSAMNSERAVGRAAEASGHPDVWDEQKEHLLPSAEGAILDDEVEQVNARETMG